MFTKIDKKTEARARAAISNTKEMIKYLAVRNKATAAKKALDVYLILNHFVTYCQVNAGNVPPSDALLSFRHANYTIRCVDIADENIKYIYSRLNDVNRADHEKLYKSVANLLDDIKSFLVYQKANGNWMESEIHQNAKN